MFSSGKMSGQGQINFDLGNIYVTREDYENAIKHFNLALSTDPGNKNILEAIQKIKEAIKSQRKAIDNSRPMILYTAQNINTDLLNWYYENGYIIQTVGFGKNSWAICFIKNEENLKQRVFISPDIPEKQIEAGWSEGLYITHGCYGQNKWIIALQNIRCAGSQQWLLNSNFPEDAIDTLYEDGFQITTCDYGDAWFVVLDENSIFSDQEYRFYDEYPEEEFENLWDEDIYVDRLLYARGKWLLIQSSCDLWDAQGLTNKSRFPFAELEKEFGEDSSLPTSIAFDGTDWNIIYTSLVSSDEDYEEDVSEENIQEFTIEQAKKELDELTGLGNVKEEIENLMSLINLNKIKEERGLNVAPVALHMVFTGNPGTGKTTVARITGRILRAIGILTKGHLVEADRSRLVAEYVGQTAIKTNAIIDQAMDGVLFIDEAYSLAKGDGDFGQEAIETLLKRMEDDRNRLVVIIAGYTEEIEDFIRSNPGLKSRFNTYLHFEDYTANELLDILRKQILRAEHQLSAEAGEFAEKYFQYIYRSRDKYFGNARDVRNLLEDIVKIQSARLSKESDLSDEQLRTISKSDFQLAVKEIYEEEHELSIEEVMRELNSLTGLENIKQEIAALVDFIKVEQLRKQKGLTSKPISLHSVFYGPPGTGKTTVARLLGKVFKTLGLLPKGEVNEVSRANLVAEYVGQTAIKTGKVIDDALNGVLFIDEAYSLSDNQAGGDFGKEAIETLLKRMEDDRARLCVIIAGYTDKMEQFISSNPGLRSRFTNYFHFDNYTAEQLLEIIKGFFSSEKFVLDQDAEQLLEIIFNEWLQSAGENFGNARDARNLFEKIKLQQSRRVARLGDPSLYDLTHIVRQDVANAVETIPG